MRKDLESIIVRTTSVIGAEAQLADFEARLSAPDRERAGRFRLREDRARFVLGRTVLAKILRAELGGEPAMLELALTDKGRPYLPGEPRLHFSITHAGDWVAVALAIGARVGIDIESPDRRLDPGPLAERIFHAADLARFRALPDAVQPRAFFRAWTGKEAVLKAKGLGLPGGLREISVPLEDKRTIVRDEAGAIDWQLAPLDLPPNYLGAVAWDDPRKTLNVAGLAVDQLD
jgi:4'-phosphopantetheinyl transferase